MYKCNTIRLLRILKVITNKRVRIRTIIRIINTQARHYCNTKSALIIKVALFDLYLYVREFFCVVISGGCIVLLYCMEIPHILYS